MDVEKTIEFILDMQGKWEERWVRNEQRWTKSEERWAKAGQSRPKPSAAWTGWSGSASA
jgi:hypothetical protein